MMRLAEALYSFCEGKAGNLIDLYVIKMILLDWMLFHGFLRSDGSVDETANTLSKMNSFEFLESAELDFKNECPLMGRIICTVMDKINSDKRPSILVNINSLGNCKTTSIMIEKSNIPYFGDSSTRTDEVVMFLFNFRIFLTDVVSKLISDGKKNSKTGDWNVFEGPIFTRTENQPAYSTADVSLPINTDGPSSKSFNPMSALSVVEAASTSFAATKRMRLVESSSPEENYSLLKKKKQLGSTSSEKEMKSKSSSFLSPLPINRPSKSLSLQKPLPPVAPSPSASQSPSLQNQNSPVAPSQSASQSPSLQIQTSPVAPSQSASQSLSIPNRNSPVAPSRSASQSPFLQIQNSPVAPSQSASQSPSIPNRNSPVAPSPSASQQ